MGFMDMLADIAKTLGAFAVLMIAGIYGLDGFFVGEMGVLNYLLLGIGLVAMLFVFYMIQSMQSTTY